MGAAPATVIVATYGNLDEWEPLAQRAVASAEPQGPVVRIHGENLHEARNAGADLADSEWLCFLDADDELEAGYLDTLLAGTADLRGPAVRYLRAGRRTAPVKVWPEQDLAHGNHLVIGTLVRRHLFLEVGGFKDWPMYEDWDLWQRCWLAGATVETIPTAVYRAHVRAGSRNRGPNRATKEATHHAIRRANGLEPIEAA